MCLFGTDFADVDQLFYALSQLDKCAELHQLA